MKALIVCVDYWDFLSVTLPVNKHHFSDILVVTTPTDYDTIDLCEALNVQTHKTNSFYDKGALFNKWIALEEGLDILGRDGWLCLLDADIIWPETVSMPTLGIGKLYGPRRRMSKLQIPESRWKSVPLWTNEDFSGWTQIFHASDPALPNPPPWHQTNWKHAGGADTFFQNLWSPQNKIRLPFEVLHIGDPGTNWCGRVSKLMGVLPANANERRNALKAFMETRRTSPSYVEERLK